MQVDNVERLGDRQRSDILALVEAATEVDRTPPLSEQVLLAVRGDLNAGTGLADGTDPAPSTHPAPGTDPAPGTSSRHILAYAGTQLAGYAHLKCGLAGEAGTAEVVVDPAWRRQGVGTALVRVLETALEHLAKPLQLWSHGHLDPARAFALRDGYSTVRELWQMHRLLRSGDDGSLPAVSLPEGFHARAFVVGQDEEAWLRVNARAFVDHPEQGRMTRQDLDQRIDEPWFDAAGFILIEDTRSPAPVLAASHWTKVVQAQSPQTSPALHPLGEVYVVGVDPAYQGLGLGRAVTVLGLAHLREQGLTEAMLYVDADNRAAVATYARLGFTRCAVDVMYSPTVHPPV